MTKQSKKNKGQEEQSQENNNEQIFIETTNLLAELKARFQLGKPLWHTENIDRNLVLKLRDALALFLNAGDYYYENVVVPLPKGETVTGLFREEQKKIEEFLGTGSKPKSILNLKDYSTALRLQKKGLSIDLIAKFLNVEPGKFRADYYWTTQSNSVNQNLVESEFLKHELEDYCKVKPKDEEIIAGKFREALVSVAIVNNLRKRNLSNSGIATQLNLDQADFSRWLNLNEKYLKLFDK